MKAENILNSNLRRKSTVVYMFFCKSIQIDGNPVKPITETQYQKAFTVRKGIG